MCILLQSFSSSIFQVRSALSDATERRRTKEERTKKIEGAREQETSGQGESTLGGARREKKRMRMREGREK